MGTGFLLREITLRSLPFESRNNITIVPILPEDSRLSGAVVSGILNEITSGKMSFIDPHKNYLGYVMPVDYVMQGMIADTGGDFHLYKKHHTFGLIMDWVLHPFEHLRRPPAAHMAALHHVEPKLARKHHCPLEIKDVKGDCDTCPYRRVILVKIEQGDETHNSRHDLLALTATKTPVCFMDLNAQDGTILKVRRVEKGTAWQEVPTPEI